MDRDCDGYLRCVERYRSETVSTRTWCDDSRFDCIQWKLESSSNNWRVNISRMFICDEVNIQFLISKRNIIWANERRCALWKSGCWCPFSATSSKIIPHFGIFPSWKMIFKRFQIYYWRLSFKRLACFPFGICSSNHNEIFSFSILSS